MAQSAKLILDSKTLELPTLEGSEHERAIDISALRAQAGYITLDPAYGNTGACKSGITYIDGEKGILRYRGYAIEDLAEHSGFIEVAWLLIFGELPTTEQRKRFSSRLAENATIHEGFKHHFQGFPATAPPMAILSAMINTLACFNPEMLDVSSGEQFEEVAARLISKVRTIAAYSHRMSMGLPYIYPDSKLPYVANFLHMMFSMPYGRYDIHPEVEQALNLILLLHADHEQNLLWRPPGRMLRRITSKRRIYFASCAAGVCALWGPLHGGANVEVLDMLAKMHCAGGADGVGISGTGQAKESAGTLWLLTPCL